MRPLPVLLDLSIQQPTAADEHLLWMISDGGEPYGTELPAFEDKLNRDQLWKVITSGTRAF